MEHLCDVLKFDENTVFGNQTPLYFDAYLKEVIPTLKYGATTIFIPKQLFMFPIQLVEFLNEHKINTLCWVVSALTMISTKVWTMRWDLQQEVASVIVRSV